MHISGYKRVMVNQAITTAGGVFFATAVLFPLDRRYRAWKASRAELTLKRDRHGNLVPDLTVKRAEQAAIVLLVALAAIGLAVGFTIMAP